MAFSNPYQGITLPSIQKPSSEDYLAPQRATKELITSVDAHLKKVDTEKADRATAALMEAQNAGDVGYISSIMDYAVNNINDPDKRNALVNSGRGALENTAVTQFNYKLAQARDSGDVTTLAALDADIKNNPLYSPTKRNELFTLLQTNKPVIEETGLVKGIWNNYQADEQANIDEFKEAAQRARVAITSDPKDSDYFNKLLSPDDNGGYTRVAITPANAADFLGLPPESRTPETLAGAVNTVREIQAKLFDKYGAELNKGYKLPEDPLVKAKQALTKAMMGRGKDPAAAVAKVVSASAMLQDPNKQASYESAIASNKAAADASRKVIEDKAAFAASFIKSDQAKLIAGSKAPLNLTTALNGITTDWLNLGGYNRKEATEITLDMKKNFTDYGLSKAPTDEELAYAITMSMATGFGDDPIVKKDTLADVLKIHLESKPVNTDAAKRQIINAYNKNVSDRETLLNNIKAREAQANLEAAYRIKGDRGAYLKGFGTVIEANRRQNLEQSVIGSSDKKGIPKYTAPTPSADATKLMSQYTPAQLNTSYTKLIKSTKTPTEESQKQFGDIAEAFNLKDPENYIIPSPPSVTITKFEDLVTQLIETGKITSDQAEGILQNAHNDRAEKKLKATRDKSEAVPVVNKSAPKLLTISDSPTVLLDAALKRGFRDYDHQSNGTYKKRSSNEKPLTVQQFVDKLNAAKEKVGVKR